MQHVSEGQINEPSQEGADSAGSSPSEPYVLAEEIPEELVVNGELYILLKSQE